MKWLAGALALALGLSAPAFGATAELRKVVSSLPVDFDGDGKMDLAELVLINPNAQDSAVNDNKDYWVSKAERVDLVLTLERASGKVEFVKRNIVDQEQVQIVSALESKSDGSISLRSCYGCGAMASWEQTLTIAYRKGTFVVAGYSRYWEWYRHASGGDVEGQEGGCDINYLSGKGTASRTAQAARPLKARFKLATLARWSGSMIPKACRFY